MSNLAINGGTPALKEPLEPFYTIGHLEAKAVHDLIMKGPLSGYLGGSRTGGYYVEKLEKEFAHLCGAKHAVACNSATSGILIALMARGDMKNRVVRVTPYTMSGSVAPAIILGADIVFGDIDEHTYCLQPVTDRQPKGTTITTNLFGHPGYMHPGCFVIEDAAQSILASRDKKRLSPAHITVFSANVHKQIQCGEGGMCVTNDDFLDHRMRMARNHGEMRGTDCGLNLRLTEIQAAIWSVQLKRAVEIVKRRQDIAQELSDFAEVTGIGAPPVIQEGCEHSFYVWSMKCKKRDWVAEALKAEGIPMRAGYMAPLYKWSAFEQQISRPNVEAVESQLIVYENCAYEPRTIHMAAIKEAFRKVADANRG